MKTYQIISCFVIAVCCVSILPAQTDNNRTSKEEQKYHDKKNQRFVNSVEDIQTQINAIRSNDSLSDVEKRERITPLFEEMRALRAADIASREWTEKEKKSKKEKAKTDRKKSQESKSEMADSGKKPKRNNMNARQRKKRIKYLQKEIQDINKNKSMAQADKDMKLEPLMDELVALQKRQVPDADIAMDGGNERVLKTKAIKEKGKQKDKWKAEEAKKKEAKMNAGQDREKAEREKAREKRDAKIEKWKSKARKEQSKKKAMAASADSSPEKPASRSSKTDTESSEVKRMDKTVVHNQTVSSSSETKSSGKKTSSAKSGMFQRLSRMTTNLERLKSSGLLSDENFKLKMGHIRAVRERFLGV